MCLPQGMPGMMLAIFPMEVIQTPKQVTIIEEAFTQIRRIYIGEDAAEGRGRGARLLRALGREVGRRHARRRDRRHQDERALSQRAALAETCGSTSGSRARRGSLEDQITITRPAISDGTVDVEFTYQRRPGYKMLEYVCEDNREFADPVTASQRMRFKIQDRQQAITSSGDPRCGRASDGRPEESHHGSSQLPATRGARLCRRIAASPAASRPTRRYRISRSRGFACSIRPTRPTSAAF